MGGKLSGKVALVRNASSATGETHRAALQRACRSPMPWTGKDAISCANTEQSWILCYGKEERAARLGAYRPL